VVGTASRPTLVGRDDELVLIDEVLDAARRGRRAALCLRGEAGVGKSALLAYGRAAAVDMTVLATRGIAGVGELAFAGLSDLVRPLLGALEMLSDAHRSALGAALGFEPGMVQPLTVASAFLNLVSIAASERPVLVLVDDLPSVDRPSLDAVLFAARRLDADGVAFLFARSDEPSDGPSLIDIVELPVVGLSPAAARDLLGGDVVPRVADEIRDATDGNVLAMLELAGVLDAAQRRGRRPIDDPVPVSPQLRAAFERRVRSLPTVTQRTLRIVAADWTGDARAVVDAIRMSGLPEGALGPAERTGVVRIAERIQFGHALLRAVIADATPAPERRAAHATLADAFARLGDVEQGAWHRAEACVGTDEDVAKALSEIASDARRRGALLTAARAFERAARLSRGADERARRQFAAGESLWLGGRSERAVVLFADALDHAQDPRLRADIAVLCGQAEMWASGPQRAREFLLAESSRVSALDAERATLLLAHAVTACLLACDVPSAVAAGERARATAAGTGGLAAVGASVALGIARLHHGDADAVDLLAPAVELADAVELRDVPEALHFLLVLGLADLFTERWDRARRLLDAVIAQAQTEGLVGLLPFALAMRSELHWRNGEWHEAAHGIRSILELVEGSEKVAGALWAEGLLARVEAGMGSEDSCRARAAASASAGRNLGMDAIVVFAESALGLLELGLAHNDAAFRHLQAVSTRMRESDVGEPGIVWWAGDFIETAWRCGRLGQAATGLRELEAQAATTRRTWPHAVAARGRGMLAGATTFADEFEHALRWHADLDAPFELARTKLAYGERLTEYGRIDAARIQLNEAAQLFARVGAVPWATRARTVAGEETDTAVAVRSLLTEREMEVATVVGRGASNQQAAEALFLSAKTIDFHLRNVYRKLGLQSRTQLAVALERQGLLVTPAGPRTA
jgi:DNA-binding CsgD family transcriptional regulator